MENRTRPRHRKRLVERRKHNRFKVQGGGFVSLYPYFTVVGQIMDIGSGGLAFAYPARETRTNGLSQLQILATDHSFCFKKVPFRTVWDFAVPQEFSLGSITLRRCGVQFGELTRSYEANLEYFMRYYTLGGVSRGHAGHPHSEREIAYAKASSCFRGSTP